MHRPEWIFGAGSEIAFVKTNKGLVKKEAEKKENKNARILAQLRENPEKTLSVIQIGITFVGAFASAIGGALSQETLSPWFIETLGFGQTTSQFISVLIVVIPITYLSVVFGELVPKTLGMRRPLFFAMKAAPWLHGFSLVTYPIVVILEKSTKGIITLIPRKHVAKEVSEEESAVPLERLETPTRNYVLNIVKLEETVLGEIIVDWKAVVTLDQQQTLEEVEATIITAGHTRLPVLKGNQVVGLIHSKEFFAFKKLNRPDWPTLLRPILSVPDRMPILSALRLMQKKRMHMMLVEKEKNIVGMVTLEEILEEIVGEIYDEDDDGAIQRLLSKRKR